MSSRVETVIRDTKKQNIARNFKRNSVDFLWFGHISIFYGHKNYSLLIQFDNKLHVSLKFVLQHKNVGKMPHTIHV